MSVVRMLCGLELELPTLLEEAEQSQLLTWMGDWSAIDKSFVEESAGKQQRRSREPVEGLIGSCLWKLGKRKNCAARMTTALRRETSREMQASLG